MVHIGVLALQGAFIEHQKMMEKLGAQTSQVRLPHELEGLDGLIMPGGESTTIGKLATEYGLIEPLRQFAQSKPTWGTCAGLIFLAKDIGIDHQPILGLMDVRVDRNAFGRQLDSFEKDLPFKGLSTNALFPTIFIRAPIIRESAENVEILAKIDEKTIVAVKQEHLLGTAFHPELTDDLRVHEFFLKMVTNNQN